MKKLFPLAVLGIALTFTSCKKDYTCTCTEVMPGVATQTTTSPMGKTTKSKATDACNSLQTLGSANGGGVSGYSFTCHI